MHQYPFSDMASAPTSFQDHGYTCNWERHSSNVLPSIQTLGEQMSRSMDLVQSSGPEGSEMFSQRQLMNLQTGKESNNQDFSSALGEELSLTLGSYLSSDMLSPSFNYREADPLVNQLGTSYLTARDPRVHFKQNRGDCLFRGGILANTYSLTSMPHNYSGSSSLTELHASLTVVIQNSRYLKPVQSLLEEVISISKVVELESDKQLRKDKSIGKTLQDATASLGVGGTKAGKYVSDQKRNALCSSECSSADKQDIQIRITKLVALLEEVNNRYEQYRHQMEEVVSSFEVVAGLGSAKIYTTLALKAMSRHFCSLRNAIVAQICAARQCLPEDAPKNLGGLARLSLFDQNARQKKSTLQQLGMFPVQQPWRPLRGLPENAVAILRAWLFEHFLHPYPNDSEKLMLATQTGLTRNQVSNWFINARVRLWKPMIEEMYKEEIEEASANSNASNETCL